MDDLALAHEIIGRLNKLLETPGMGELLGQLTNSRVVTQSEVLANHETIQFGGENSEYTLGWLGLVNGIVGARAEDGWGYVAAVMEEDGSISSFKLTP